MTNEQKVGLFILIGIVLAFAGIEYTFGTGLGRRGYHLWVEFRDVQGLTVGDVVRVAGVKGGSVDAIELQADHVRVRLRLQPAIVVHSDSIAKLDFQALSGNRFIAISLGSATAAALNDGDSIQGEAPPGITDMVGEMQKVAKSVDELATSLNQNQQQLVTNLDALIEENRRALAATLANVESITEKLDRGDGTAARLLNDPQLYDRLAGIAGDLQVVSGQLARGEGTAGRLLREDELYEQAREALVTLNQTARDLQEVAAAVRNGEGTLGRLITDDSLYVEAQSTLRDVDRAAIGLEDQSPIAILGSFVSTLF